MRGGGIGRHLQNPTVIAGRNLIFNAAAAAPFSTSSSSFGRGRGFDPYPDHAPTNNTSFTPEQPHPPPPGGFGHGRGGQPTRYPPPFNRSQFSPPGPPPPPPLLGANRSPDDFQQRRPTWQSNPDGFQQQPTARFGYGRGGQPQAPQFYPPPPPVHPDARPTWQSNNPNYDFQQRRQQPPANGFGFGRGRPPPPPPPLQPPQFSAPIRPPPPRPPSGNFRPPGVDNFAGRGRGVVNDAAQRQQQILHPDAPRRLVALLRDEDDRAAAAAANEEIYARQQQQIGSVRRGKAEEIYAAQQQQQPIGSGVGRAAGEESVGRWQSGSVVGRGREEAREENVAQGQTGGVGRVSEEVEQRRVGTSAGRGGEKGVRPVPRGEVVSDVSPRGGAVVRRGERGGGVEARIADRKAKALEHVPSVPKLSTEEATKKALEVLRKAVGRNGGGRGRGRGNGRGRGREGGLGGRKDSEEEEDGHQLYLGDDADGARLARRLGDEKMRQLEDAMEEIGYKVLPSPLDDEYKDALNTNHAVILSFIFGNH